MWDRNNNIYGRISQGSRQEVYGPGGRFADILIIVSDENAEPPRVEWRYHDCRRPIFVDDNDLVDGLK
jgi:hypothetical protein